MRPSAITSAVAVRRACASASQHRLQVVAPGAPRTALERRLDHPAMPVNGSRPLEERLDRDLVGGVEHRRRGAAGAQRRVGEAAGRESAARRAARTRVLRRAPGRAAARRTRCAPGRRARARSARACRDWRAARSPSRRRTRPANGRCSADGSPPRCARARRRTASAPRSPRAPLFIMVAESTEILRPITQFGCAQACSGVTPSRLLERRGAERPAGGGQQDSVGRASSSDKHWKTALCSLSIGSSCAPRCAHRAP